MLGSNGDPLSVPTEAEVLNDVPKSIGFKFRPNGDLEVSLSDGSSFIGGRVLLMDFRDPTALVREGANLFSGFDAAGVIGGFNLTAADNTPGSYGLGVIQGGSLELSNVDLTEQFAELITTQRSFQAGSRIITVSDDILNEVVNLKR
jgi:flagellar hook protein FlgE